MQRLFTTIVAALLTAAGGCGGGVEPEIQDGVLGGSVTVQGAPLADLTDSNTVGEQDVDKWSLRLIDPTEDVDSISIGHTDTTIVPAAVPALGDYLLAVDLLPAVDLSGGAAEVTPVTLSIPLTVTENLVTTVEAEVDFISPQTASALRATAQGHTEGHSIRLQYRLHGPVEADELVELVWATRLLRRDTDGDGDLSDEVAYTDSNRDCISDAMQERLRQPPRNEPEQTTKGILSGLELQDGRLAVGGVWFQVDEGTAVWHGNTQLQLGDLVLGDRLTVNWRAGDDGERYAYSIHLQEPGF